LEIVRDAILAGGGGNKEGLVKVLWDQERFGRIQPLAIQPPCRLRLRNSEYCFSRLYK